MGKAEDIHAGAVVHVTGKTGSERAGEADRDPDRLRSSEVTGMLVYAAGSLAARIATVLCVLLIALPFLLRRRLLAGSGGATAVPSLRWM